MMYRIYYLIILSILLTACEKIVPAVRDFATILTLPTTGIDKSGATFNAEVLREGSEPISSFGFIWTTSLSSDTNRIVLGENIKLGTYNIRIDSCLVGNIVYKVRAFISHDSVTVYGNMIEFKSKGSLKNPWSYEASLNLGVNSNWNDTYGSSDGTSGYIITYESDSYIFDPVTNVLTKINNFFPVATWNHRLESVTVGDVQYFISGLNRHLYKLEDMIWSVEYSYSPVYPDQHIYTCFHYNDQLFFLSSSESRSYSLIEKTWTSLPAVPGIGRHVISIGGSGLENNGYALTSDKKLWEYNTESQTWKSISNYPGNIQGEIISFTYNNSIYLGLSFGGSPIDNDFWSYKPSLNKWTRYPKFPFRTISENGFFDFFLGNKLYFGGNSATSGGYNIWSFNASK